MLARAIRERATRWATKSPWVRLRDAAFAAFWIFFLLYLLTDGRVLRWLDGA